MLTNKSNEQLLLSGKLTGSVRKTDTMEGPISGNQDVGVFGKSSRDQILKCSMLSRSRGCNLFPLKSLVLSKSSTEKNRAIGEV